MNEDKICQTIVSISYRKKVRNFKKRGFFDISNFQTFEKHFSGIFKYIIAKETASFLSPGEARFYKMK